MSATDATDATADDLTDPELISRVREGDVAAYGTLFSRHVDAATRLARLLVGGPDADDLVSEAFVKVLNVLLGGGGPDVAFRAYLLTAVRRLHVDKLRGQQKVTTAGDMTPYDPGVPFTDPAVAGFEGGAAAKAFASLPERWQMVLWHLEVENQKPADIAPLLGMSANSVSALAYRAREGLRQAFLTMHAGDLVSEACKDTNDLMGGYVRQALSRRDTARVEDHLDHCRRCTAVYLELDDVNSSLAGLLGPVLLGGAAAGYLGGGAAVGAGVGVAAVVGRIRDVAMSNLPATAAATVTAVGVAGIASIAIINRGPSEQPAAAEPPGSNLVAPSTTPSPSSTPSRSPRSKAGQRLNPPAAPNTSQTPSATASALAADSLTGTSTLDGVPATTGANGSGGDGTGGDQAGDGNGTAPGPTKPPDGTGPDPTKPPHPKPSEPEPSSPPPSSPTPTKPPALTADVQVDASASGYLLGFFHARADVTGVPAGQRVRVHVSWTKGDMHNLNGFACHRVGKAYDCTAGGDRSFLFGVHSHSGATVTFSVSPPAGWTDPKPDNNSDSVTVARRHEH